MNPIEELQCKVAVRDWIIQRKETELKKDLKELNDLKRRVAQLEKDQGDSQNLILTAYASLHAEVNLLHKKIEELEMVHLC